MLEHDIIKETTWVEQVACIRQIRHRLRFLVEHPNGRDQSDNLGLYERIIFFNTS
jgi:hypothetical protein